MSSRGKWLDNCLHKNRAPSKSKDGPEHDDISRYFQVCVNILEGKKFAWTNHSQSTSYVTVALDKVKYRSSLRQNMPEPYYRENFVFELFTSAGELKRKCVWLAVMEPGSYSGRRLGEASIDLAQVWTQPHRRITQKWVQLALPSEAKTDPVGYLKVDVSISVRGEVLSTPEAQECMDNHLLLPYGSEQQPACYQITVYRAYNVPCSAHARPEFLGRPPSTCLRVTFCDLGETSVLHRNNNPVYIQRVSMVEMFPSVCQLFQLEVCSAGPSAKVLASAKLKLSEISHGGENGFLPTFGPSLLHMYGPWRESSEDGPFHRGALLVTLKTIVPYYKQCIRTVNVEPANATALDTEWIIEDFILFCPVFEVSMLDKSVAGTTCGVAITLGEIPISGSIDQDPDEFVQLITEIKQKKQHYTGSMGVVWNSAVSGHLQLDTYPVLQLAARLPDFRFRMYRNNVIYGIVDDLENELSDISDRLARNDYSNPNDLLELLQRSNDDAAAKIQKYLDIAQYSCSNEDLQKYTTELDQKFAQLQKEKIERIYCHIISRKSRPAQSDPYPHKVRFSNDRDTKKTVKIMLAECRTTVQELKDLIFKTPDGWPDISIWLLSNGSRIAHTKMAASDIIHSVISEQNGRRCGKIQTVYLEPIKCPKHRPVDCCCISAKVELLAWMGAFRQRSVFQYCLPTGYRSTESGIGITCEPLTLECCINIYRAKLDCGGDLVSLSPFVRINFLNNVKDTQVCLNNASPVWCEVLRVSSSVNTSVHRLDTSPPEILVEVYHWDGSQTGKADLLGRAAVEPIFLTDQDTEMPSMEWFNVQMGKEHVGKIQMSAHLMQITPSILKKSWNPPQALPQRPSEQIAHMVLNTEGREPLPVNLMPANVTYKIDVYFWGLREVSITSKPRVTLELEDITIKSAIISECRSNCNFPNARISQKFQGNITDGSSPLSIKLYETTTFGRTLFAGLNVVKRPQKYLVTWVPKKEREESLFMKPIVSNMFMQVNQKTFVKRSWTYPAEIADQTVHYKARETSKVKSFWEEIFHSKNAQEEKLMLLPIYAKEKSNVVKDTEEDWWTRYYASLNDKSSGDKELSGNRIMIYDSELEAQPEFSRFKDWCSTIKIYNGDKTGIPENDEKLCCGYLKACIAIYQWPPPADAEAVTSSGIDLGRGYFDSAPTNDPARYLVRVYAVRCTGLASKGFTTVSKCHVAVQCSKRRLGDRESGVPRSSDPVFGKMFELECTIPEDYLLEISLMDSTPNQPDELIGSTAIDLEDRVYTKYRATVGLAAEYNINGPNKWRDCQRPSAILGQLCERNRLPAPEFPDPSTVVLNGVEYKDLDSVSAIKYTSPLACKENLCLGILRKWYTLPLCGHTLVPEHVETRALYDSGKSGVEQGKIHLWLDMFPVETRRLIPAPVSIRPRPDEHYELRVIVWGVEGVRMAVKTSIYVRAWIGPSDEAQDTDIYSSSCGEGHFNWRMIFQFQYKLTEKKLVLHDKGPFTEVTELFPPYLVVQVLDIDASSLQDYLGTLTLDLSAMPLGARHTAGVVRARRVNLFATRTVRGWWPLRTIDRESGNYHPVGMVDLELSLLPREKALLMPVGLGRDPPAPLSDPVRQPQTLANTKSNCSMSPYRQGVCTLIGLGLLLVAGCMYLDMPLIVFSVIPSSRT